MSCTWHVGYRGCTRLVNQRELQIALHTFEIAHAQFANFWHKHNPNPTLIPKLTLSLPNSDPNQT